MASPFSFCFADLVPSQDTHWLLTIPPSSLIFPIALFEGFCFPFSSSCFHSDAIPRYVQHSMPRSHCFFYVQNPLYVYYEFDWASIKLYNRDVSFLNRIEPFSTPIFEQSFVSELSAQSSFGQTFLIWCHSARRSFVHFWTQVKVRISTDFLHCTFARRKYFRSLQTRQIDRKRLSQTSALVSSTSGALWTCYEPD